MVEVITRVLMLCITSILIWSQNSTRPELTPEKCWVRARAPDQNTLYHYSKTYGTIVGQWPSPLLDSEVMTKEARPNFHGHNFPEIPENK